MEPHLASGNTHGSDEGTAIGGHGNSLLLGWTGRDLLRRGGAGAVREALPPDMKLGRFLAEVHPLAVRRPCGRSTGRPGRADFFAGGTAIERNCAARLELAPVVCFGQQDLLVPP